MLEGVWSKVPSPTVGSTAVMAMVVVTTTIRVGVIIMGIIHRGSMAMVVSAGNSLPSSGRRLVHLMINMEKRKKE